MEPIKKELGEFCENTEQIKMNLTEDFKSFNESVLGIFSNLSLLQDSCLQLEKEARRWLLSKDMPPELMVSCGSDVISDSEESESVHAKTTTGDNSDLVNELMNKVAGAVSDLKYLRRRAEPEHILVRYSKFSNLLTVASNGVFTFNEECYSSAHQGLVLGAGNIFMQASYLLKNGVDNYDVIEDPAGFLDEVKTSVHYYCDSSDDPDNQKLVIGWYVFCSSMNEFIIPKINFGGYRIAPIVEIYSEYQKAAYHLTHDSDYWEEHFREPEYHGIPSEIPDNNQPVEPRFEYTKKLNEYMMERKWEWQNKPKRKRELIHDFKVEWNETYPEVDQIKTSVDGLRRNFDKHLTQLL